MGLPPAFYKAEVISMNGRRTKALLKQDSSVTELMSAGAEQVISHNKERFIGRQEFDTAARSIRLL
jgi:hypothetical protein